MNNSKDQTPFEVYENPSLLDLYNFIIDIYPSISDYEKNMFNINTFEVIEYYIYGRMTGALYGLLTHKGKTILGNNKLDIQSSEKQSTFYLGGHIKYNTNEKITQEMIDLVQKKINNTDMTCCWGMEIYSVMEHNSRFESFKQLYKNYKEFFTHIKFSPDNIGYIETKEHFYNDCS